MGACYPTVYPESCRLLAGGSPVVVTARKPCSRLPGPRARPRAQIQRVPVGSGTLPILRSVLRLRSGHRPALFVHRHRSWWRKRGGGRRSFVRGLPLGYDQGGPPSTAAPMRAPARWMRHWRWRRLCVQWGWRSYKLGFVRIRHSCEVTSCVMGRRIWQCK